MEKVKKRKDEVGWRGEVRTGRLRGPPECLSIRCSSFPSSQRALAPQKRLTSDEGYELLGIPTNVPVMRTVSFFPWLSCGEWHSGRRACSSVLGIRGSSSVLVCSV